MQLNLLRPQDVEENGAVKTKPGCIFLDIAKPKNDGSERMDWDNKITMKISSRDIADIVLGVRAESKADIIHKVNRADGSESVTTLKIEPGERQGTFKWFVGKMVGSEKSNVTVYLDTKDMYLVFQMLEAAIPVIHGWSE